MPRKKQPKYKVGEVVIYSQILPDLEEEEEDYDPDEKSHWYKPGCIGIIVDVWDDKDKSREDDDCYEPYGYSIYWFNERITSNFAHEISRCIGIKDKILCKDCEHRELCPHLPDIARCEISEFGQVRKEGEYNPDVCKQRQCTHFGVCLTTRFIQKED